MPLPSPPGCSHDLHPKVSDDATVMVLGFVSGIALRAGRNNTLSWLRTSVCRQHRALLTIRMSSSGVGKVEQKPTMVRARHILVESEEMVDAIKQQLDDGAKTFAELATLVSTCSSKERGGDLGWFRKATMVKEFEDAAFSNPPGSVVKVKSEFGWHLIKVEDHGIAAKSITVKEYHDRFAANGTDEANNVQLIDCREVKELELASLPGFLNLPMGEYDKWADDFDSGDLGLDKHEETIVMCHHGVRSANFCTFLAQQGFTNVRNLIGGIDAYAKKMDPSVPLY